MTNRFAVLLVLALVAACGTSPNARFFALEPVPPQRLPAAAAVQGLPKAAAVQGPPVAVNAFRLPGLYDRLQMVRRGADNRVEISPIDRWGEPLDRMARRVLARDLALRLPPGTVIPPGAPRPSGPVRALVVDVQEFDADASGRVVLDGEWTLVEGVPERPVAMRPERIEVPPGKGQAAAMSDALGILADRIASQLPGIPIWEGKPKESP